MQKAKRVLSVCLLALALAAALPACDASKEDSVVGDTCSQNAQCRFLCATGPAFPGGFCTLPCQGDNQCPRGDTLCMDRAGGVCLFTCINSVDCVFLGPGWACRNIDRVGGGRASVCIGD